MANYFARILYIMAFTSAIDKSIIRHVHCQTTQHHLRHSNHHHQHLRLLRHEAHRSHPRMQHNSDAETTNAHFTAMTKLTATTASTTKYNLDTAVIKHHENQDALHRAKLHHDHYRSPPDNYLLHNSSKIQVNSDLGAVTSSSRLSRSGLTLRTSNFNGTSSSSQTHHHSPPPILLQLYKQRENDLSDYDDDDDDDDQEPMTDRSTSEESEEKKKKTDIKCPKCNGTTNVQVSEEELVQLRIEFVKNQILRKLRLKERPKVSVADLPRPLYEGATMHGADERSQNKDLDDYYARTSQKFIFLEEERQHCAQLKKNGAKNSLCFQFQIDDDIEDIDVSSAEIWIYKNDFRSAPPTKEKQNHNEKDLVVSEVNVIDNFNSNINSSNRSSKLTSLNATRITSQSVGSDAGWIRIDIGAVTKNWFRRRHLFHIIQISCDACERDSSSSSENETSSLLSIDKDYRPFILIDTVSRRKLQRQKRNVDCSEGVTDCCREKLYISFADIGWDDWILQPPGYDAYFCRGSCSSAATIAMSNNHHTSVLRKVIFNRARKHEKALELIPCCVGKRYSSLKLMYLDSNKTATVKTLPNMVVESCGCM